MIQSNHLTSTNKSRNISYLSMAFDDRVEIIKLFIAVLAGFAAGGWISGVLGDTLSTILVSASAIVIVYYILGYAESFLKRNKNRND